VKTRSRKGLDVSTNTGRHAPEFEGSDTVTIGPGDEKRLGVDCLGSRLYPRKKPKKERAACWVPAHYESRRRAGGTPSKGRTGGSALAFEQSSLRRHGGLYGWDWVVMRRAFGKKRISRKGQKQRMTGKQAGAPQGLLGVKNRPNYYRCCCEGGQAFTVDYQISGQRRNGSGGLLRPTRGVLLRQN